MIFHLIVLLVYMNKKFLNEANAQNEDGNVLQNLNHIDLHWIICCMYKRVNHQYIDPFSPMKYNFVIDYSLLRSAVVLNDQIQYFVVAQDNTSAVSSNAAVQFGTDPTSVALTNNNFPLIGTADKYRIGAGVSGTLLVGTGKTYTSLTKTGGVFEYLNNNLLYKSIW